MIRFSLVLVLSMPCVWGQIGGAASAPFYSAASIVNAATQTVGALAPNTIGTIYGRNLAFSTRSALGSDVSGGTLPTSLDGVSVVLGGTPANLFYISPGQINFLVPYILTAGTIPIWVARDSLAGPVIPLQLNSTAPGLFEWSGNLAIATHLNGSLLAPGSPGSAGEIVVIYAAGLGRVTPDTTSGRITGFAATIVALSQMQILLDGVACPPKNVLYAGLAPGFAGLYQINLRLPDIVGPNPEIRISIGAQISPAAIRLPVR